MIVGMSESFIDYPDKLSIILFTKKCSWNCINCHNKINLKKATEIPYPKVIKYLKDSLPLINHLVISGGEPTEDRDIIKMIKDFYELGYIIKLDTNGSNPEILKEILPFVSCVAMDIKTSPLYESQYKYITDCSTEDFNNVSESIGILSDWHKLGNRILIFRTTLLDDCINTESIKNYLRTFSFSDYIIQPRVQR